ncbi:O-antigen ligase family protein [Arthrobacter sp. A5]|uniref:O-antigen ligase family protein n=1 Tax=Arthrobacter sp. A5 TaxID=576926 RepID=UPI003DA8742C
MTPILDLITVLAILSVISQLRSIYRTAVIARDWLGFIGMFVFTFGGLLYETALIPQTRITQFILLLLLVLFSSALTLRSFLSRVSSRLRRTALLPALISFLLFFVNALMNEQGLASLLMARLLPTISLIALTLMLSLVRLTLTDLCRVSVLAISLVILPSLLMPGVWRACDKFKCGPFGGLYSGPFESENTAALFAVIGILSIFFCWKSGRSYSGIALMSLVLYATESRTSQLAFLVALLSWGLISITNNSRSSSYLIVDEQRQSRRLIISLRFFRLLLVSIFASGFYFLVSAEPESFSNRGGIWIRGLLALGPDWVMGLGMDRWSFLQSVGLLPPLFPHSQYLLLLFGGGALAVVALFALFNCALKTSLVSNEYPAFGTAYIMFLAVMGITEAFWNPVALDGHNLIAVPVIYILATSHAGRSLSAMSEVQKNQPLALKSAI